jgi:hypothetical protein
MSTPLKHVIIPNCLTGIHILLFIVLMSFCASAVVVHAKAKSSTWQRSSPWWLSMSPEYRKGLWVVSFISCHHSMPSMCFSHKRADSGCPWMVYRTWMTVQSCGIGGSLRWSVHHSPRCASLMKRYNGAFGDGASVNALLTSNPIANMPSCAAIAQNSLLLIASNAFAYTCPSVTDPF